MSAQLDLEAPPRTPEVAGLRRRARAHLESPSPIVLPRVLRAVTELADRLALGGFVRADAHGVTVEIEGAAQQVESFLGEIGLELIGSLPGGGWTDGGELPPLGAREFAVLAVSARRTALAAHRGSDVALCAGCVGALFDPTDPRHGDPFLGCGGCRLGQNPAPGHGMRLRDGAGREFPGGAINGAITLLMAGRIVAVRQPDRRRLYADATRPAAVGAISALTDRVRNVRLVALCPDLEWVRRLAVLSGPEAEALSSRRNPVLLVEPLGGGPAADLTPPDSLLAVTLPGCGLTHLLARGAGRPLAFIDLAPRPLEATPSAVSPASGVLRAEPLD